MPNLGEPGAPREGALSEFANEPGGMLSTVPATRADVRIVLAVLAVSTVVFLAAAPFAKVQLPAVQPFLPAYQSALVITDLITAVLLYGQFAIMRSRSLLVLASGYVFCAFMAIAHALSFPGLFAEGGAIGGGPQTTAWLYFLWHAFFPLCVVGYAFADGRAGARPQPIRKPAWAILLGVAAAFALGLALTLLATAGHDALPEVMRGDLDNATKIYVASATWALSLIALAVLWRRRRRTVLDVWLMVVMCVWMFDVALAAVLNHGRFDVGWYSGRVYGLLAMSVVLMVLLVEYAVLQARLVAASEAERRQRRRAEEKTAELLAVNQDLEAFSYSVSHDLRAPLRSIDGFSAVLQEDYAHSLDDVGRGYTERIRRAVQRMAALTDDLLGLAQVSRADLRRGEIDLTRMAREVADTLKERAPGRDVDFVIAEPMQALGDSGLVLIVLENLIGNAWKFTSEVSPARIEVGQRAVDGLMPYFVRDNGAGFDMAQAGKLFRPFQRLHTAQEFPGTGIGLAIVRRIVAKHGGQIWAESEPGTGTTFYFTLPDPAPASPEQSRAERSRSAA